MLASLLATFAHHIEHLLHVTALADDVVDAVLAGLGRTEVGDLLAQVAGFQRLADDDRQFVEVERLVDVVVGAQAHRLDGSLQHAEGGDHDDDQLLVELLGAGEHFQPVHAGELDIEEHQVGHVFLQLAQGVLAGCRGLHLVALLAQRLLQGPADQVFVVDNQNFGFTHWYSFKIREA